METALTNPNTTNAARSPLVEIIASEARLDRAELEQRLRDARARGIVNVDDLLDAVAPATRGGAL